MKRRLPAPSPILALCAILLSVMACGSAAVPRPEAGPTPTTTAVGATAVPTAPPATSAAAPAAGPAAKIKVVTTTNIVADWVRRVGGDRTEVFSLVPVDSDPHTFQPGARDISRIADADLVVSIGLSLEAGWLDKLIENTARDPRWVAALGDVVDPLESGESDANGHWEEEDGKEHNGDEDGGDAEEHNGDQDPHFWFDPLRAKKAVNDVAARLSALDPAAGEHYRNNAAAYNRELDGLHGWIEDQVAGLPQERRVLVTSHDSLQYFAVRYGFRVAGAVFSTTTEVEPGAQDLSRLIETIEREGVPAVFSERSHSDRLARRVAEETGATVIGGLYTGSLGESGGEAGTYLDLMRHNTKTIVEALR